MRLTIRIPHGLTPPEDEVLASTVASFKGYESEIIIIPAVEQFVLADVLATNLYFAMTRARSVLSSYGHPTNSPSVQKLIDVLESSLNQLVTRPQIDSAASRIDEVEALLDCFNASKNEDSRRWLNEALEPS